MLDCTEKIYDPVLGPFRGINPASTPWIGDIDQDNQLDVLFTYMCDTISCLSFHGIRILRKELPVAASNISWSSYMGNRHDGKYAMLMP